MQGGYTQGGYTQRLMGSGLKLYDSVKTGKNAIVCPIENIQNSVNQKLGKSSHRALKIIRYTGRNRILHKK